jgi:glycosyltransferase involved in cell wall biosynthesis
MIQPIRLIIQQPSLAKYRVPVFRELARRHPDIDFTLLYGTRHDLTNADPDGFAARPVRLWQWSIAGQRFYWHWPQWSSASRKKCDVLLLTWNPRYLSFLPALLRAKMRRVPTILWGHGASQHDTWLRKKLRYTIAKLATALLFYNEKAAQEWRQAGRDSASIFVAKNSLDQEPIRQARMAWQDPGRLLEFKKQQGLLTGPVLLFVSRLYPKNRLEMLIEATAMLTRDFPNIQTIIVGKGAGEPERLTGIAKKLQVENHIRFTGAIYDEIQLAPWFLSADVFAYPTYIGLSLLHAFGYGLPVVTCDDPKAHGPEIDSLRNGENGLLYRTDDVRDFANTIRKLLHDKQLARQMSAEALRTVEEEVSLENMVDQMAAAVRYCTSQHRQIK